MNASPSPPAFTAAQLRRSRFTLLLLATLFFAPILGAAALYYLAPGYRPTGQTNYGTLIDPARPLPSAALLDAEGKDESALLRGKWSLIQLGAASCDPACAERFVQTRQVRLALGKYLSRLQRIYIAPGATELREFQTAQAARHPDAKFVVDTASAGALANIFKSANGDANALYLVDPNGNWLMVYRGEVDSKKLLKDLKTLMRLSSIG